MHDAPLYPPVPPALSAALLTLDAPSVASVAPGTLSDLGWALMADATAIGMRYRLTALPAGMTPADQALRLAVLRCHRGQLGTWLETDLFVACVRWWSMQILQELLARGGGPRRPPIVEDDAMARFLAAHADMMTPLRLTEDGMAVVGDPYTPAHPMVTLPTLEEELADDEDDVMWRG